MLVRLYDVTSVWLTVPQKPEGQRITDQIDAAMISAGANVIQGLTASIANVNRVVVRIRVAVAVASAPDERNKRTH